MKERHGNTWYSRCLVEIVGHEGAAAGTCVPTSGGMDYHTYVCANPKDVTCAVYTTGSTDAGAWKRCYAVLG